MGTSNILMVPVWGWALTAGVFALISGTAFGDAAYHIAKRKALSVSMLAPTRKERILLVVKGGIKPLRPLAKWMYEKVPYVRDGSQNIMILLEEYSLDLTEEALLSLLLGASFIALLTGWLVSGSIVFGIAAFFIVIIGVFSFVRNKASSCNDGLREQIPEMLRSLSMSFRTGHSLPQTLSDSAQETKGYLGHLFSIASDRLEMGATPTEALAVMKSNPRVPELSFIAVALEIQHRSGGSIAPVLESATEAIEGELKLARSLRVQTAQAKLSASIVTIMPFILIALFSFMSPDFLAPFFSSFIGMALLTVAIIMEVAGVLIVRNMLKVNLD